MTQSLIKNEIVVNKTYKLTRQNDKFIAGEFCLFIRGTGLANVFVSYEDIANLQEEKSAVNGTLTFLAYPTFLRCEVASGTIDKITITGFSIEEV